MSDSWSSSHKLFWIQNAIGQMANGFLKHVLKYRIAIVVHVVVYFDESRSFSVFLILMRLFSSLRIDVLVVVGIDMSSLPPPQGT